MKSFLHNLKHLGHLQVYFCQCNILCLGFKIVNFPNRDKQKGEETGVEEANKLDKPNKSNNKLQKLIESGGSDCLFVLVVYWKQAEDV